MGTQSSRSTHVRSSVMAKQPRSSGTQTPPQTRGQIWPGRQSGEGRHMPSELEQCWPAPHSLSPVQLGFGSGTHTPAQTAGQAMPSSQPGGDAQSPSRVEQWFPYAQSRSLVHAGAGSTVATQPAYMPLGQVQASMPASPQSQGG